MGYLTGVKDDFLKIIAKYILATGSANSFKTLGVIPYRGQEPYVFCVFKFNSRFMPKRVLLI